MTEPIRDEGVELTILMPCLNEAETIADCVAEARAFLAHSAVVGEVLVADNGSTDDSRSLAEMAGARVIEIAEPGYGSALRGGIAAAKGRYVAMGDADMSYDFAALGPFLDRLRAGADLVIGNRFEGGIAPGAMPALHQHLGNPVLSFIGRLFFGIKIGDFHCGLRAVVRSRIEELDLQTTGMEFASEMIVMASLAGYRIEEIPTTLAPDGRSRAPHLRSWHDGWRHLRFLLLFSPRWLFQIPGLILVVIAVLLTAVLSFRTIEVGQVTFSNGSLMVAAAMFLVGMSGLQFDLITRAFALTQGYRRDDPRTARQVARVTFERSLIVGVLLVLLGIAGLAYAFNTWRTARFGNLVTTSELRVLVPASVVLVTGCQIAFTGIFVSLMKIRSDLS